MFKAVKFNIFEEGLGELVYGKEASAKLRESVLQKKNIKKTVEIKKEIILKPQAFASSKENLKTA